VGLAGGDQGRECEVHKRGTKTLETSLRKQASKQASKLLNGRPPLAHKISLLNYLLAFILLAEIVLGGLFLHANKQKKVLSRTQTILFAALSDTESVLTSLTVMEENDHLPISLSEFAVFRAYRVQAMVALSDIGKHVAALSPEEQKIYASLTSLFAYSTYTTSAELFIRSSSLRTTLIPAAIQNKMIGLTVSLWRTMKESDRNLFGKRQKLIQSQTTLAVASVFIMGLFVFLFLFFRKIESQSLRILTLQLSLIERLIIPSNVIEDWKEHIRKMLIAFNEVIGSYSLFACFLTNEDVYEFDIFWMANPSEETKTIMTEILKEKVRQGLGDALLNPDMRILHTVIDTETPLPVLDLPTLFMSTKTLILKEPKVGGIVGVGIHSGKMTNSTGQIVVESLLTTVVNILGSIKAMYLYTKDIQHMASHDVLTDLPNRRVFLDRIEQTIIRSERTQELFAVGLLDLDGFKSVNDRLGHQKGDELLIQVTKRLEGLLRKSDTLARLGGDEFGLLLTGLNEGAVDLFTKIVESLLDPFDVGNRSGEPVRISGSMGITLFHSDPGDATSLIAHADLAMYRVKDSGRNGWAVFASEMEQSLLEQHRIRTEFERAITNGELCLHYQPQVNMETGQVIGVEALVRWNHPERGVLAPNSFMGVVEKSDLILPLGRWVFETALLQQEEWDREDLPLRISVNIGARHFLSNGFIETLRGILSKHERPKHLVIELEVTETEAIRDLEKAGERIDLCRSLEIPVSLDDFGTGEASLISLQKLDVKEVKIDVEFVHRMLESPKALAIVSSLTKAASMMLIDVVAEGVETEEEGELLLELGCRVAQGYIIARPMPPSMIPMWAREWRPFESWKNHSSKKNGGWKDETLPIVHQALKIFLKEVLSGLDTPGAMKEEWMDPLKCVPGQWMDRSGRIRYGGTAQFDTLGRIYNSLFSLASEALSARDRHDIKALERLKSELTETAQACQDALQKLSD